MPNPGDTQTPLRDTPRIETQYLVPKIAKHCWVSPGGPGRYSHFTPS